MVSIHSAAGSPCGGVDRIVDIILWFPAIEKVSLKNSSPRMVPLSMACPMPVKRSPFLALFMAGFVAVVFFLYFYAAFPNPVPATLEPTYHYLDDIRNETLGVSGSPAYYTVNLLRDIVAGRKSLRDQPALPTR